MDTDDIEQQLIEINERLQMLSDKQNAQFTEMMLEIKKLSDNTSADRDHDYEDEDELYEDAKAFVIKVGKASTSLLQRQFRIGYGRAARLLDLLEDEGIVGPANGATPRKVLISK